MRGRPPHVIPGRGMHVVGVDIAPGRYRCAAPGKAGQWIRYPDGGALPVVHRTDGTAAAEVTLGNHDVALESDVAAPWVRLDTPQHTAPEGGEVRLVIDPALPADILALLLSSPEALESARKPRPERRARLRGPLVPAALTAWLAVGVVSLAWPGIAGVWLLLTITVGVAVLIRDRFSLDDALARQHADRYFIANDFDDPTRALLLRAQTAIDAVANSAVNREGLLDTVDNAITLPEQEWEIAVTLAKISRLRAELPPEPELAGGLAPMWAALETAMTSTRARIEALEAYAKRAMEADRVLLAEKQLRTLAQRVPEYQDLLAEVARDELAMPDIARLTARADDLVRTLQDSLDAVSSAINASHLPPIAPIE